MSNYFKKTKAVRPAQLPRKARQNNKSVVICGIKFDSQWEADRYLQLLYPQEQGIIRDLQLQKKFELIPAAREPDTVGKRGGIKQGKIISIFSLLATALSLIGVFGQVLLDVQYRRRDLAVKKVYGAEISDLVIDGLKRYAIIGIASYVIAVPVAYYAVSRWLENFVEHTALSAWIFISTFVMIMVLTIAVAGFQYWSSANADPSEALKKE